MFLRWSIWWSFFLILRMSTCQLEISESDSHEVICLLGLSECIIKDGMSFAEEVTEVVDIRTLTPYIKLCCNNSTMLCTLCLVVDIEISIDLDKDSEDEDYSGSDKETENPKASVTVCYQAPNVLPTCKKAEFTVSPGALSQKNQTKISIVFFNPTGVSFSSQLSVKSAHIIQHVVAPSLAEVCRQELRERVQNCHVPSLNAVINKETKNVDLKFAESDKRQSLCVQYEKNGTCQKPNRMTIPLHSVVPCMCFQVWYEDEERPVHSQRCPFINSDDFQSNIWQNVSVSVDQGQMTSNGTMLLWNLSAPCRLEAEVWPCRRENSCREMNGFRQQLRSKWRQNSKGLWEIKGVFEDINLQLSPCVKVTVQGHELGPFCLNNNDRVRWSLLVVSVLLLICMTALTFYFLHDYVKKWVWSWNHCEFVKIPRKSHVVLLSPPDVDDGVSELVCGFGSQLRDKGFSVSVDQWSRKEQCTWGPLPWLHSQLQDPNSRVVLFLTHSALQKTEEWALQHKDVITTKSEDKAPTQTCSPYSDVFTATLHFLRADKHLGRAQERFLLVMLDFQPTGVRILPKLLQGLPLFQHPSQTKALLAELTVRGRWGRSNVAGRTCKGWKWDVSDRWKVKSKEGPDQQSNSPLKNLGVEIDMETKFLQQP
ncbi:hypothetical protein Q5P01_001615 [Channa striata]|uniref:SEFIR domain-containing protein n=1 Tax=Channa striata TaxID=64152 RepID=A0AA88T442_CHASR|nr:hypothetical protein Q5P01_001615 [Channa striata]